MITGQEQKFQQQEASRLETTLISIFDWWQVNSTTSFERSDGEVSEARTAISLPDRLKVAMMRAQEKQALTSMETMSSCAPYECVVALSIFSRLALEPKFKSSSTSYSSAAAPGPPWQTGPNPMESMGGESKEWIAALRAAYPDQTKMPPELKEMLDKQEQSALKQAKSELHKATNGLYRAKGSLAQLLDARKKHQLAWCKHIQTSITSWKEQSKLYAKQQDDYAARIQKAQEEIAKSQHTIGLLNMKAVEGYAAPVEQETPVDSANNEKEIQILSEQLMGSLKDAIQSVKTTTQPEVISEDGSDQDGEKQERKRKKGETEEAKHDDSSALHNALDLQAEVQYHSSHLGLVEPMLPLHSLSPDSSCNLDSQTPKFAQSLQHENHPAASSSMKHNQDAAFPDSETLDFVSFMQSNRARSRSRNQSELPRRDDDSDPPSDDPDESDPPSDLEADFDASLLDWTLVTYGSPAPEVSTHAGSFGPSIELAAQTLHLDFQDIIALHVVPFLRATFDEHVVIVQRQLDLVLHESQVMIILDISCHHAQPAHGVPRPPHDTRTVRKVSSIHSFRTFMQEIGLLQFARDYNEWGALEINGVEWSPFNTHARDLTHGDHVLVQFAPHSGRDHRNDLNHWLLNEGVQLWSSNTSVGDNPVMSSIDEEIPSSSHHPVCHASPSLTSLANPVMPDVVFMSWYVSHMFHPVCREPRILTLTQNSDTWKRTIAQTWDDVFDASSPFALSWVFPKPPGLGITPNDMYPHLVISQHPVHRQISAVITVSVLSLQDVQVEQAAHSIPEISDATTFQDAAETTRLCQGSFQCEVTFDGRTIPHHPPTRRPDGLSVHVLVSEQVPSQDHFDLMQRSSVLRPVRVPDGGTGSATEHASHSQDASSSHSGDRLSMRQRAFTRLCSSFQDHLLNIWTESAAVECQEEGPVLYVATYFLAVPHIEDCVSSRPVRLTGHPRQWFSQLREAWRDVADLTQWIDVFVVHPYPVDLPATSGIAAHVLLVQSLDDHHKALLVTTVFQPSITYHAMLITPQITRRQVIARTGMIFPCFSAASPHVCTVTFGWLVIDNTPCHVENGAGLQLLVSTPVLSESAAKTVDLASAAPDASGAANLPRAPPTSVPGVQLSTASAPGAASSAAAPSASLDTRVRVDLAPLLDLPAAPPACESFRLGHKPLAVPGLELLCARLRMSPLELTAALPMPELFPVEFASQLHSVLLEAPPPSASPVAVSIFTDGSALFNVEAGARRAAWSFVVVSHYADLTCSFDGFQSAMVAPPMHEVALPLITAADSHSAESEAIFRALCWCAASDTLSSGIPVCIVSDALAAMHGADGLWNSSTRPFLESIVRPLFCALQTTGKLTTTWEKAHSGVLFNEVADHVARSAAREASFRAFPPIVQSCDLKPMQWLWLAWKAQLDDFGVTYESDVIHLPVPPPLGLADVDCWPKRVSGPSGKLRIACTFSTYNVNTLTPKQRQGRRGGSTVPRKQLLREQASDQACLFLQETRTKTAGSWKYQHWFGFVGPAQDGQGGVELWCNTRVPFGYIHGSDDVATPLYFRQKQCSVLFATHRTLIVHFQPDEFECLLASAHAPHEFADESLRFQFWTELRSRLSTKRALPVILGIDANSRLGSEPSAAVGPWSPDPESPNGFLFRQFLEDVGLFLPTTFPSTRWHSDQGSGTWLSPNGWKRIDFVALPMEWRAASCVADLRVLDVAAEHDDHVSLTLTVDLDLHDVTAGTVESLPSFSRLALRQPSAQPCLRFLLWDLLESCGATLWRLPADQQEKLLQTWFSSRLHQCFPPQQSRPRPSCLSPTTWSLLRTSRSLRRTIARTVRFKRVAFTRHLFLAWRSRCQKSVARGYIGHPMPPDPHWQRTVDFALAKHLQSAAIVRKPLIVALRADEAVFAQQKLEEYEQRFEDAAGANMWKALKPILPKQRAKARLAKQRCTASASQEAMVASTGTRPGDPMADLSFSFIMRSIATHVVQDLRPILSTLHHDGTDEVVGPVIWVDDFALFIEHEVPDRLLDLIRHAAHRVLVRCREKGLQLNLSRGKSEVVVRLQGRGSHAAHLRLREVTPDNPPMSVSMDFECDICQASFESQKALAVHRLTAHQCNAPVRAYMPLPTTCFCCLRDFHGTQKLRQHLQYTRNGCLARLQELLVPLTPQEIQDVPTVALKTIRNQHRTPAVQLCGPLLPTKQQWRAVAPHRRFPDVLPLHRNQGHDRSLDSVCVLIDWILNGSPDGPDLADLMPTAPVPALVDTWLEAAAAYHNDPSFELRACLAYRWALGFVRSTGQLPTAPLAQQAPDVLPRVLPFHQDRFFVLYLYAGHVRPGDVHHHAARLSSKYGFVVEVLPIDIVFDDRRCNLRLKDSQELWLRMVEAGAVLGVIAAPPCETWSAARWRSVTHNDGGPRPMRCRTSPWCLPDSSIAELRQVQCANELLCYWLRLALVCITMGTSWLTEHPAEPHAHPEAASIWRLPEVLRIKQMDGVRLVNILQGLYGGVSAKPTGLLSFALPSLPEALHRWRLADVNRSNWETLVGRESTGQWKTAKAKAYPSALNGCLIEAFFQRAIQLQCRLPGTDPPCIEPFLAAIASVVQARSCSGKSMGHDYAG
eukprot:Skav219175  [mRNA]  locus=scaffold648:409701:433350:- [translate_table: standard]